eukprot:8215916-Pyramimonas_sp.AAC.2
MTQRTRHIHNLLYIAPRPPSEQSNTGIPQPGLDRCRGRCSEGQRAVKLVARRLLGQGKRGGWGLLARLHAG